MPIVTRRQFVQQALAASALCTAPIFRAQEQHAAVPDAAAIRKLASSITGHVITPDSSDYESARQVENDAYDRHPAAVVRCVTPSDVARILDFGQSRGLPLAVRSGGHSAAGYGACDGGIVIDLSEMRRVEVDRDKRVAHVQAGALVRDVDEATQRFGLATTLGACPTVGIGGLTLGGGLGALTPKYGTACDNLLSAHVVKVDSRQVEASQESNPDLFWAIRGGGGNFGVVTAFEYRLHPVSQVLAGTLVYSSGQIAELLRAYVKLATTVPDEMSLVALIFPSERGPTFLILVCHCGQASVGNDLLRPLRDPIKPVADTVKVMPYTDAQASGFAAKRNAYFVTNLFVPEVNDAAIAAITTATRDRIPKFRILISRLHGAVSRIPLADAAFALREPGYDVELSSYWSAPEEKASAVQWARTLRANLEPFSHGLYINGLSDTGGELVRSGYGPNYARLLELKKKYDPSNVLRLNPNIDPALA